MLSGSASAGWGPWEKNAVQAHDSPADQHAAATPPPMSRPLRLRRGRRSRDGSHPGAVADVEVLGGRLAGVVAGCLVAHLGPPLVLVLLASIRREYYPEGSVFDRRLVNVISTATVPSTAPPGNAAYAASGPAWRSPSIFSKSAV